jgi:carbon storage regulator
MYNKEEAMLVLSRKKNETIVLVVDGTVLATLMVTEMRGDNVRLGIEAPNSVSIHRKEVWDDIVLNGPKTRDQSVDSGNSTDSWEQSSCPVDEARQANPETQRQPNDCPNGLERTQQGLDELD